MITGTFIILANTVFLAILGVFGTFQRYLYSGLADNVQNNWETFIGYTGYFEGFFPVDTFLLAFSSLVSFILGFYFVKMVLWALSFLPWFSPKKDIPGISTETSGNNVVDLRGRKPGQGYRAKRLRI